MKSQVCDNWRQIDGEDTVLNDDSCVYGVNAVSSSWSDPCDTVKVVQMAMPQRDETIEEIKRLDALLEYAVMHDDEAEAARLRAELTKLVEKV